MAKSRNLMAKSRNKFDKSTKTSCTYQLTFKPSCFMQTMQVHPKALECIFSIMICNLEGSRPEIGGGGATDVRAIDTNPGTEDTSMGRVREGDCPLSSGGYGGSPPEKFRFLECQRSNLRPS